MADAALAAFRGDGATVVTVDRPEARDAVNLAVAEGVAAPLDEPDRRDDQVVGVEGHALAGGRAIVLARDGLGGVPALARRRDRGAWPGARARLTDVLATLTRDEWAA